MKFKNLLLAGLPVLTLVFASCTDDNETEKENITVLKYEIPTTYEFKRGDASTVEVGDQKARILMLTEIGTYISSGKDAPLSLDKLTGMYANTNAQFTTEGIVSLNESINLKGQTATSMDYFKGGNEESKEVQEIFENTFKDAVTASQPNTTASAGVAGKIGTRLYAANGIEPGQVVAKGMMGAQLMDQVLNNFLSKSVLDAGKNRIDNANKVLVSGTNYTAMEHAWDQAYGCIYGGGLNASGKTYFWENYIGQVNDQTAAFGNLRANILNAFIAGRAAITGNDYAERDKQIAIIKENFSKIPAIRGVHYLMKEGYDNLATGTAVFHALSEGYGFVMSLRYTNNPATNKPYFTKEEVDGFLADLSTGTQANPGIWDLDNIGDKLKDMSVKIAAKFNFSIEDAKAGK